jgi:hypothetical protein
MLGHRPIGTAPLSSLGGQRPESLESVLQQIRQIIDEVEEEDQLQPPPPPRQAERLLNYVLPRTRREEILGDLEEDYYNKWLPKYGVDEARRLYWADAIRSIAPMLWTAVKRSGIITFILGAADWLRDRLG